VSVYGHPWLVFEPLKLLQFDFNADPDPAFHSNTDPETAVHTNTDPDPAFQTNADPDPQLCAPLNRFDGSKKCVPTVYIFLVLVFGSVD
jgi:hypothetical protein